MFLIIEYQGYIKSVSDLMKHQLFMSCLDIHVFHPGILQYMICFSCDWDDQNM